MKTQLVKLIILASLFLTACKPQKNIEPYIGEYTELMADGYTNYYCDYPKTLDELISHFQNTKDKWIDYPIADTVQSVLSFLEKEKDDIIWQYSHPTFVTLTIGAMYKYDTLFYKTTKWYYPYIDCAISSYIKYHLDYPKSLDDLLLFDSIVHGKSEDDVHDCWDVTRKYYWDNRDELEWVVKNGFLLIMACQDTIAYSAGISSYIRCNDYLYRNRVIVFTDIHGKFDYSDETRKSFLQGLKSVRKDFLSKNQCGQSYLYMVEYRRGVGLSRFCENEEFSLDTKWFKEIGEYVSQFAQEYELEKILFYTPAY